MQTNSLVFTDKFLENEPPTYDSSQIAGLFFEGTEEITLMNGRMTLVNESENFELPSSSTNFNAKAFENLLPEEIISAKGNNLVKYRIFISDDGEKLNYLVSNSTQGRPQNNELLIYIEGDNDALSEKIMHVLAGNDVTFNENSFRENVRQRTGVDDKEIDELLESLLGGEESFIDKFVYLLSDVLKVTQIGFNIVSSALGKSIKLIDKLKIKENIWNPTKEKSNFVYDTVFEGMDTLLDSAQSFLNTLDGRVLKRLNRKRKLTNAISERLGKAFRALTALFKDIVSISIEMAKFAAGLTQHFLSLVIGVWNGLVDMISGLLFIIKLIVDGGKVANKALVAVVKFKKDPVRQRSIIEQLDNVIDRVLQIDFLKVFKQIFAEVTSFIGEIDISAIIDTLKDGAKKTGKKAKEALSFTSYEVCYYIGYVVTFFIPIAPIAAILGKAGKLGGLLGKTLLWVDKLMEKIVGVSLQILKNAADPIMTFLRAFAKRLQGGTQTAIKSVKELVEGIKRWLDDKLPTWRKNTDELDNIGRNLDSVRTKKLDLDEWKDAISRLGGVVKDYKTSKEILEHFEKNNVGAAFDPRKKPPTIWIRTDEVSDLQMFHEAMHFEDFLRRGKDNYMRGRERDILPLGNRPQVPKRDQLISKYIKEKYVLDKVLEEQAAWIKKYGKGRFSDSEIAFSQKYFKKFEQELINNNIDVDKILIK